MIIIEKVRIIAIKMCSLVITLFLMSSCDRAPKDARKIMMQNNSAQKIVFLTSDSYPDTQSYVINGCGTKDIGHIVASGELKEYRLYGKWEDLLVSLPSNTMMFFVYNADSASRIADNVRGCDSLLKRPDLILKRFDVSVEYLNAHDWRLIYE